MILNRIIASILLIFLFYSFPQIEGQSLDSLSKNIEFPDSLKKVNQETIEHLKNIFSKFKNERPKIGLVLAGGGAKGFAHVGVLQLLDSLNIPVDYIAGNSMGGLIGALYAIGYSGKDLEVFSKSLDWNFLLNDNPPREELPFIEKEKSGKYQLKIGLKGYEPVIPSGLIYGQNIQMFFHKLTAPYESVDSFDDLPTPFRCVAVDLLSGEQVVLKDGSLAKAMRATMSIPSAFSPVEWDDYLLVDGLVLNNYPVDVVKNMGADIVIGLNLTTGKKDKTDFENLLTVFDRMLDIPTSARLKENIEMTDIYISQDMSGFSTSDFSSTKTDGIIQRGRDAGSNNNPVLLALREQLEKYKDYKDWVQQGNRKKKEEIRTINDNYIDSKILLGSYEIRGADNFSENFIGHHLKLQVNDVYNNDVLLENIEQLYALNYFESISFQTRESGENKIHLIIEVKEKPLNRLVTGFRYDDYFKIVGLVGLETNSVLLSGTQFQTYLKFGGLTTLDFKFLYPSRSMDMPIYPFLSARYSDIPLDFYFEGKKIFRYRNRSWKAAGGLNFSLSNSWNLEASLDWEWMNIFTEIASQEIEEILSLYDLNARIVTGKIQLLYDSLDDIIIPNSGVYFKSYYERTIPTFGSVLDYNRVFGRFDAFLPLAKNHNLRLDGAYMKIWDKYDSPFYKWFYLGGPDTFVGLDYFQAAGTEFTVAAISYRYEFLESIYLKGTFNTIFNYTLLDGIKATEPLFGYGISALMKTILGKIEIMWARGDENVSQPGSKSNKVYFILGYNLR